jgi:hypothetical protein
MSFKITITNNETGEVLVSHDNVGAILGGLALPDGARGIALTSCAIFDVARCANAAEKALHAIRQHHPELHLLEPAIRAAASCEEIDRSTEAKDDAD